MQNRDDKAANRLGFSLLRSWIENVESRGELYGVPPEAVLAVIITESYGSMFFCTCDAQYKENIRVVKAFSGFTESQFIDLIRIRKGPYKGEIPKFRMEPGWEKPAQNECRRLADRKNWKWRLMCSFGLGQKGMVWHLSAKDTSEWENAFWEFVSDPLLQIKVCAHDLAQLRAKAGGDWHTIFTRYNAGGKAKGITKYSEKCVNLMKQLSS